MENLITALSTLLGAAIGVLGIWLAQRDTRRMARLERINRTFAAEIDARQKEEDITCQWLTESMGSDSIEKLA